MNKGQNSKSMMPELWFVCIALLLNEIDLLMKFHVDALHSFKIILRIKKERTDGQMDGRTSQSLYATLRGHKNRKQTTKNFSDKIIFLEAKCGSNLMKLNNEKYISGG